ncbi:hypothetical protein PLICRDRAFT_53634 [Plicaturopsis crispa FD-325 SS-3]|nr:hypothetical protein PLICRDRAFT_53634 [Plicaturopsis crispa FD-325 SS-3]
MWTQPRLQWNTETPGACAWRTCARIVGLNKNRVRSKEAPPSNIHVHRPLNTMSKGPAPSNVPAYERQTHPPDPYDHSVIHQRRCGVYTVAYQTPSRFSCSLKRSTETYHAIKESAPYVGRFFAVVFSIAPWYLAVHIVTTLWMSAMPALDLWLINALLVAVEQSFADRRVEGLHLHMIASAWLASAFISVLVDHARERVRCSLRGYLRAHFLPQMMKARLSVDVPYSKPEDPTTPSPWNFQDEAPGWDFIAQLFRKLRLISTILLQGAVTAWIFSRKPTMEMQVLSFLCAAQAIVMWLSPTNGRGGEAWVYWTDNKDYDRLHALYYMAFTQDLRDQLVMDGTNQCVQEEYERRSNALGPIDDPGSSVSAYAPRPWYWRFLADIAADHPMALYAFALPWIVATSSLTSMVFLHQATSAIRLSITEYMFYHASFAQVLAGARNIFRLTELPLDIHREGQESSSMESGMKISFCRVSFKYPREDHEAIRDVSFDILPGQLVVVVGEPGSGKSTTLNLLARLRDPDSGDILVDDRPLKSFIMDELRKSMAFISQTPHIYPLSIRDNIQLGLKNGLIMHLEDQVENAAKIGGSFDWITTLPHKFETALNPLDATGRSAIGLGHDGISEALGKVSQLNKPLQVLVTDIEKERLVASRAFFRMANSSIKLLVADMASSALSPVEEQALASKLREMRPGKTMILVPKTIGPLVKQADLILCMDKGTVVEQGTHVELLARGEAYAKLYQSQKTDHAD